MNIAWVREWRLQVTAAAAAAADMTQRKVLALHFDLSAWSFLNIVQPLQLCLLSHSIETEINLKRN